MLIPRNQKNPALEKLLQYCRYLEESNELDWSLLDTVHGYDEVYSLKTETRTVEGRNKNFRIVINYVFRPPWQITRWGRFPCPLGIISFKSIWVNAMLHLDEKTAPKHWLFFPHPTLTFLTKQAHNAVQWKTKTTASAISYNPRPDL